VLCCYSDFLWRYDCLQSNQPGAVVPLHLEKQPVGCFSPAFVQEHYVHLKHFLQHVTVHPELLDCSVLDTFLWANNVTFQAAKHIKVTANQVLLASSMASFMQQTTMVLAPKKEGLKCWFAEAKTSIAGDLVR
jgi:sorting nexin-1/2